MAAAISSAVTLLGNLLIENVIFQDEVSRQVVLLRDELNTIQSSLKDANNKKAQDQRVRTWIMDIRDVAHDAADVIEMYVVRVEITECTLGCIIFYPITLYYRYELKNEIKWIQARLKRIDERRQRYGIEKLEEYSKSPLQLHFEQLRRLVPEQKGQHLVGMEDDVKKVLQEFVGDNERKELGVGVLHGAGGIGKSTLAREIYNHPDVTKADRFECRVWVVVSSEFTPLETIKQLILELQKSEDEKKQTFEEFKRLEDTMQDRQYIQRKLKERLHRQLEGKSYFIILDDVWEKEHLEFLITAFPNQQDKGSRLLITSRNDVRTNMKQYRHEMKVLDRAESQELLSKKANIGCTNGMDSIMTQILEKCDGLPLAISVVGGLLVGKQTISEWKEVLEEINDHLGREESSVSAILELSYQNLSPHLKSCFLRFAFFKEDATIPVKWLEDMWISQCLIQHEENRAADKIARGYLNELINRSLIQVKDVWEVSCQIHDLVREVCLRKAKEELSLEVVKGKDVAGSSSATATATPYKARHRVVYGNNLVTSKNQNKCVRSLFLLNVNYEDDYLSSAPTDFWKSFKLLQTLHLEGFEFERLPESLGLLIGLKILRIVHKHGYHELLLPTCRLNKLKKLEVLTVENADVLMSKDDVALEIETLRHLDATCGWGFKIGNCKSIETIEEIFIDDWLEYISEVTDNCPLRELGLIVHTLKLSQRRDDKSSRVRVLWEKMTNLVKLHLSFNDSDLPLGEVIPGHLSSLTTLTVSNLGVWRVPISTTPAAMFPRNLSHLILDRCILSEDGELMEIGNLPNLRYLALVKCRGNKRIAISRNAFPCLQVFCLQYMWKLREIDIEEGGMRLLKELQICDCPNLETLNLPQHDILISHVT